MAMLASPSLTYPPGRTAPASRFPARLACAIGLAAAGFGADLAGGPVPLGFAAILILGLGLPHGASDHLVAMGGRPWRSAPGRLAVFLLLYLGAAGATLLLWQAWPGPALAGFLLLSAVHFGIDDVADAGWTGRMPERIARGLMPVTLPALLHSATLAELFAALSSPQAGTELAQVAGWLAPLVLALAAAAAVSRARRGEREQAGEIALGAAALVLFSPLVGFALVFALVHSRGQTRERMAVLRLPYLPAYLRACAPTLLGAASLFLGLAVLFADGQAPALGCLFVGLAALTVPHMLVTPLFAKRGGPAGN